MMVYDHVHVGTHATYSKCLLCNCYICTGAEINGRVYSATIHQYCMNMKAELSCVCTFHTIFLSGKNN